MVLTYKSWHLSKASSVSGAFGLLQNTTLSFGHNMKNSFWTKCSLTISTSSSVASVFVFFPLYHRAYLRRAQSREIKKSVDFFKWNLFIPTPPVLPDYIWEISPVWPNLNVVGNLFIWAKIIKLLSNLHSVVPCCDHLQALMYKSWHLSKASSVSGAFGMSQNTFCHSGMIWKMHSQEACPLRCKCIEAST